MCLADGEFVLAAGYKKHRSRCGWDLHSRYSGDGVRGHTSFLAMKNALSRFICQKPTVSRMDVCTTAHHSTLLLVVSLMFRNTSSFSWITADETKDGGEHTLSLDVLMILQKATSHLPSGTPAVWWCTSSDPPGVWGCSPVSPCCLWSCHYWVESSALPTERPNVASVQHSGEEIKILFFYSLLLSLVKMSCCPRFCHKILNTSGT